MSGHQKKTKESFLNTHYGNLKDIHILMIFLNFTSSTVLILSQATSYLICTLTPCNGSYYPPYLQIRKLQLYQILFLIKPPTIQMGFKLKPFCLRCFLSHAIGVALAALRIFRNICKNGEEQSES